MSDGGTEMQSLDTSQIKSWRSILTLIVFVGANIAVLFPFDIPLLVPRLFTDGFLAALSAVRIIAPRQAQSGQNGKLKSFVRLNFPVNFITGPLAAVFFLLAISAIGRKEVHDGTLGTDGIAPIDVMAFFITLAYIAISIDASGLIKYLSFKVLQKAGKTGHVLFLYLYIFFFALGTAIGNDPIILSGTPFLAYMTRVSANIKHPRAWIFTQFAIANVASAILVSSNPTNLVLAGAFGIKFINYTVNMIIPVISTVVILFPCLLYIIFRKEGLIPKTIQMHELSEEAQARAPINPNIPYARGKAEEEENMNTDDAQGQSLSLEEIMNPYLDKRSAWFLTLLWSSAVMAVVLITILVLNAVLPQPVYWVTCPGAFITFVWDLTCNWFDRHKAREISRRGRREVELFRAERAHQGREAQHIAFLRSKELHDQSQLDSRESVTPAETLIGTPQMNERKQIFGSPGIGTVRDGQNNQMPECTTLVSTYRKARFWFCETFPTVSTVVSLLPFALVPFAFAVFILVQALVTKGWVPVFGYGWDHWVNRTGAVGAVGGMGFLSVVLCNFSGTNIGTTILLSRVIQAWQQIHAENGLPISDRAFWGAVYAMAIGVNYGAFSTAFSASLAGLLWRDILSRKHIYVSRRDFAWVNLPIISITMIVGLVVLIGQIYVVRSSSPYYVPK